MNYSLFIILGILPSIVWLVYYLKKDTHPEPNRMILLVFFWGAVVTLPAAFLERGVFSLLGSPALLTITPMSLIYVFFGVALVEELFKYGVVRFWIFHSRELDEPIDLPLYMIVSALGFAGLENILALLKLGTIAPLSNIIMLTAFRFVGAVFLHALVSGAFGYFISLSLFQKTKRRLLFFVGLTVAVSLHGLFNLYIIQGEGVAKFFVPLIIIAGLAVFVSFALRSLKKTRAAWNTD